MAKLEGNWYLGVQCKNPRCGRHVPASMPPRASVELPTSAIKVHCIFCGQSATYEPHEVKKSQVRVD